MVPRSTVSRDQILAAAEHVIGEHGYTGATTKAIAKAAHCSEGSLYNHFPDKKALFVECAVVRTAGFIEIVTGLAERVGKGTVTSNLTDLLAAMLEFHRRLVPLLLTTWASTEQSGEDGGAANAARHDMPADADSHIPDELRGGPHALIAGYLEGERTAGRLRCDLDCDAAATVLMGIPFNRALFERIKPDLEMPLDSDDWVARTVAVVVEGMANASTTRGDITE